MIQESNLSEKIKRARQFAGLSQKELADKLNFSDKTVSAYETGRAIPPIPMLQKISELTKYPIEELIGNSEFIRNGEASAIEKKLDLILKELKKISSKL